MVDLAPIVLSQLDQLWALDPSRRVEVVVPERLEMFCDEGPMRSVLQNFIGNAWKVTDEKE